MSRGLELTVQGGQWYWSFPFSKDSVEKVIVASKYDICHFRLELARTTKKKEELGGGVFSNILQGTLYERRWAAQKWRGDDYKF